MNTFGPHSVKDDVFFVMRTKNNPGSYQEIKDRSKL